MITAMQSDNQLNSQSVKILSTTGVELSDEQYAALEASIHTNELWEDRATMLHFLRQIFSTFPTFKKVERQLQIEVGGDSPKLLLEECILKMWQDDEVKAMFATLQNLQNYIVYALQKDTIPVLQVTGYSNTQNATPVSDARNYFVQAKLGKGGQATAYKVVQNGQVYALKVANDGLTKQFAERARREHRANTGINSVPGVVQMYGFGVVPNGCVMEMEYMDAGSLKGFINPDNIHNTQYQQLGLVWFFNMCTTFSKVHPGNTHGIVPVIHRDIKPDNFLINKDGQIKAADFGLALINNRHSVTQGNGMMGTADQMAPEIITSGILNTDEKVDVYALGITMYHYFAGQQPIVVTSNVEVIKHTTATIDYSVIPSKELAFIIEQMLQKNPAKRCTMAEAASALRHLFSTNIFTRSQQQFYADQFTKTDYLPLDPSTKTFFTNEVTLTAEKNIKHARNHVLTCDRSDEFSTSNRFAQTIDMPVASPEPAVTIVPEGSPEPAVTIVPEVSPEPAVTIVPGVNNAVTVLPGAGRNNDTDFTLQAEVADALTTSKDTVNTIFSRLERGEAIGRSSMRRIQALVLQNKWAAAGILTLTLLTSGGIVIGGIKYTNYSAAVTASAKTRKDLAELLQRPTKISTTEWNPLLRKLNETNDVDGANGRFLLQQVLQEANTNNQYTVVVSTDGTDVKSITPTVDIRIAELESAVKITVQTLDGTAQSLDKIDLNTLNTLVSGVFASSFAPSESELTEFVQVLLPKEYVVTVSKNAPLRLNHIAEQDAVQILTSCYGALADLLQKEDNPSTPAVVAKLVELNQLRTVWQHRSTVLKDCDTSGLAVLPSFIEAEVTDSGLQVRNKAYVLEDGTKVIESKFGKYSVKDNILSGIEIDNTLLQLEAVLKLCHADGSCYSMSGLTNDEAGKLMSSFSKNKLETVNSTIKHYYSFYLSKLNKIIFFSNKIQGFQIISLDTNEINNIEFLNEVYEDDNVFRILIYLQQIDLTQFSTVFYNINPDRSAIEREIKKFVNYLGQYAVYKDQDKYKATSVYNTFYPLSFGDKTPEEVLGLPPKNVPVAEEQVQSTSDEGNN